MRKLIQKQKGFTIIEIIVVFFVISMGLIGVLSLIVQNIQAQRIGKNELVASQLAQEGLELTRNIRDMNWITAGNAWSQDISNGGTYVFAIDYNGRSSINPVSGPSDSTAKLKIDASGFYSHSGLTDSIFNRAITVTDNGDYLDVQSEIEWRERSSIYHYTANTILYDWR